MIRSFLSILKIFSPKAHTNTGASGHWRRLPRADYARPARAEGPGPVQWPANATAWSAAIAQAAAAAAEPPAFLLEHPNEFGADDLAFLLRIGDSFQLADETLTGVDVFNVNIELAVEEIHQEFGFPFPHETLVNEHAGELITDRFFQ